MPRYQLGNDIVSIQQVDDRVVIVEADGTSRIEECGNEATARTRFRILANQKIRAKWRPIADAVETALVAEPAHRFEKPLSVTRTLALALSTPIVAVAGYFLARPRLMTHTNRAPTLTLIGGTF